MTTDNLQRAVMMSLRPSWSKDELFRNKARAAILAVADWLESHPDESGCFEYAAAQLRWEAL